jgi:glutathione S-transferase
MAITLYYGSGSPYAWRVWLALEHKQLPHDLQRMSFDSGDLKTAAFRQLNPRQRVPVIVDGGFALFESAAIVEYLEEAYATAGQPLFPAGVQQRAIARRLIREADQYVAAAMEKLVDELLYTPSEKWRAEAIRAAAAEFTDELSHFERYAPRADFFVGAAGAVDFTLYPLIALAVRLERRKPDLGTRNAIGPALTAWMRRVEALPYFAATVPPHWKEAK